MARNTFLKTCCLSVIFLIFLLFLTSASLAQTVENSIKIELTAMEKFLSDILVQESPINLPQPTKAMFHTWDEDGSVANIFHWL